MPVNPSLALVLALALGAGPEIARAGGAAPGWAQVEPILHLRCVNCHASHGASKGLRLDSYDAVRAGSDDGPVVLPGDVERSELARRIRGLSTPRMPFLGPPLPDEEVAVILRWIEAGLPQ